MNIYKVSRKDGIDYDEYDSFVCVAKTEEQAKLMFPDPDGIEFEGEYYHLEVMDRKGTLVVCDTDRKISQDVAFRLNVWTHNINDIEVELVGVADAKYTMPQVIVASFNAG